MGRLLDIARQAADERTAAPGTRVEVTPNPVRPSVADQGDVLPDPAAEARRQRVLAMLAEKPDVMYAFLTDTQADPEAVLLTLAIRDRATCELRIPRDQYDPFALLALIERHGATVH